MKTNKFSALIIACVFFIFSNKYIYAENIKMNDNSIKEVQHMMSEAIEESGFDNVTPLTLGNFV